ncbi:MAG TPA: RNA methyltransferase [Actinomycetota bacterium]|jgi:tRNA G18 (ribose-2'-O)-methylase SpoU|nr:RNA methyltransferase [Actinomycetota bacterium]
MPRVAVDDPNDPRLSPFLDLRDTRMRAAREPAEGFFLAEGILTIRRALAAGYEPRAVLATERMLADLDDVDVTAYVVSDRVLEATTGFPVHRGALASFSRRPMPDAAAMLEGAARVVVLEDLVDTTNVGAIFRAAAALGWDAVVLSARCGDPLYRRAVRTSMGAVFTVPWTRVAHHDGIDVLHGAGLTVIALTPSASVDIGTIEPPLRGALLVGSEGPGVSRRWLDAADLAVRIPMHHEIDSLNVATAAAIGLYALA